MIHNGRYIIDKIVQQLRLKENSENVVAELGRIDNLKEPVGFDVALTAVLEDVATLWPDVYADVTEAPAYVQHWRGKIEDRIVKHQKDRKEKARGD